MSRILAVTFLVLFSPAASAAGWAPVDCRDREDEWRKFHQLLGRENVERTWQDYRQSVLRAKPGSTLYAAFPYPKNQQEIVGNFKHAFFGMLFEGVPGYSLLRLFFVDLPWYRVSARERPVHSALRDGSLSVEILRVENWEASRCAQAFPAPFSYLLRLYDRHGTELARSSQDYTGHMGFYHRVSPLSPMKKALPALADLSTLLRTRFGRTLPIEQAQYVSVDGLDPFCSQDLPCIAFKAGGKLYLLAGGELLYVIEPTAPRISFLAYRAQRMKQRLRPLGEHEYETPMITLGFEWAEAYLIGGRKPGPL